MSVWIFKLLTRQAAVFEPGSLEEIEPSEATAWLSPLYVTAMFKKTWFFLSWRLFFSRSSRFLTSGEGEDVRGELVESETDRLPAQRGLS